MKRLLPLLLWVAACGSPQEAPNRKPLTEPPLVPGPVQIGSSETLTPVKSVPRPDPLLLAGDLLTITVFRQPDLLLEVRIPQDGRVSFPLIGAVEAAGRTQADVETTIRTKLEKDYLREASVSVTVKEYAKRRVYVVGGVTKPDGYEVQPNSRITVLQVIAAAGGFTDRAYKEFVQIVRRRGSEREVIRLSLVEVEKLIAKGQPEADLELWPDDLVVIPSAVRVAYVLGAVSKPGNIDVPNDARVTVSMAVSSAGSYTKFAATGRVQVLRRTPTGEIRKFMIDLDAVLYDAKLDQDIQLLPGDVVWVPERGIF
jgi:polysaccharide export outer membrane protein